MSAFGSRSARSDGRSREASRAAKVTVRGPSGPRATQTCRRLDLVARALDEQSAAGAGCPVGGGQPGAQPPPDRGDPLLVVLPQHVRGADQHGPPGNRHLEAAVPELESVPCVGLCGGDAGGLDLDAGDAGAGSGGTEPPQQLDGGPGGRAVAEVDGEGAGERRSSAPWVAAIHRSIRRSRLGFVVPRVAVPTGRDAARVVMRTRVGRERQLPSEPVDNSATSAKGARGCVNMRLRRVGGMPGTESRPRHPHPRAPPPPPGTRRRKTRRTPPRTHSTSNG